MILRTLRVLPALLLAAALFSFSQQPGTESNQLSLRASRFLLSNFSFVLQPDFHEMTPAQQAQRVEAYNAEVREMAHGGVFFLLGVAWYLAIKHSRGQTVASRMLSAYALTLLCAFADEVHQLFSEGRAFQLIDILVDLGGGGLAVILCGLLSRPGREGRAR